MVAELSEDLWVSGVLPHFGGYATHTVSTRYRLAGGCVSKCYLDSMCYLSTQSFWKSLFGDGEINPVMPAQ